ncbi:MAG: sugar ABC transporter substrate-binding protein [Geminicoccaceae bacterium]
MRGWKSSLALTLGLAIAALPGTDALAQQKTLRIMGYQATFEHFRPAWEWVLEEFQRRHPDVTIEDIPTAFNETLNQITVAVLGGNAPDIVIVNPVWMAQLDSLDALQPLSGLISDEELAKFPERVREDLTFDGELKALPLNPGPIMMVYNRDLMREAGLDPDAPPKTWPEFTTAIEKICALPDRNGGKVSGIALRLDRGAQTAQWLIPVIWGMGGEITDSDGEFNFTSPPVIEALQWYRRLVEEGCAQPGATVGDTRNLFAQGRAGFIFEGPWIRGLVRNLSADQLQIAPDGNIWIAPMPENPSGEVRQFANHGVIAITAQAKDKELAASFVDFLLNDPDVVDKHFEIAQIMATGNTELLASGAHGADPLTQEFVKYLPNSQALPMQHPRWLAAMDALVPHIQSVVDGADAQAEAEQAERDAQRALSRR